MDKMCISIAVTFETHQRRPFNCIMANNEIDGQL